MRAEHYLIVAAALLFALSLAAPAVEIAGGPTLSGYEMLEQGAGAWRNGVFAWYANPVLVLALVVCAIGRYRVAAVLALVGLALALSSFWAGSAAESSGFSVPAFGFEPGFYVWLSAFALALIAALAGVYGVYKVSKFPVTAKKPVGGPPED